MQENMFFFRSVDADTFAAWQDPHLKTDLRFMQFPANNAGPDSNGDNDGLFIII